jgi:hypothetical protein
MISGWVTFLIIVGGLILVSIPVGYCVWLLRQLEQKEGNHK